MGPFLSILGAALGALTQPIKDYLAYKSAEVAANRELRLAQIAADKEAVISENQAASSDLSSRLSATTKDFKQNTFWLLCVPIGFSILFPSKAEVMWHNFSLIPEFFQWLFLSVYSSIWGIPIVKGGYGAVTELLQNRRNFAVQKIQVLNEALLASELRKLVYKKGMTQEQWDNELAAHKAATRQQ